MLKLALFIGCALAVAHAQQPDPPKKTPMGDEKREKGIFENLLEVNQQTSKNQGTFSADATGKIIVREKIPGEGARTYKLFEGDIIYTKRVRDHVKALQSSMITGQEVNSKFDAAKYGKWPNAKVYYDDRSLNYQSKQMVQKAIASYHAKTCIRWIRRTNQRNYIQMFNGGGCYSMIGMTGGKQQLSLGNGCYGDLGTPIHEMMHALGFYHEQSRRDRDSYIRINWQNMQTAMRYNFEKYDARKASTLGEPYDKNSVMHYGSYAFSINRRKTIVSLSNPNEQLGQRRGFSAIDIKQLRKHYDCEGSVTPTKKPTTGGGNMLEDTYKFCRLIKSHCKTDAWPRKYCKKTCWVAPVKKICKDMNKYCGAWKRSGYCNHRSYKGFMDKSCKNSCNKC